MDPLNGKIGLRARRSLPLLLAALAGPPRTLHSSDAGGPLEPASPAADLAMAMASPATFTQAQRPSWSRSSSTSVPRPRKG
jgi:hypothetical protein